MTVMKRYLEKALEKAPDKFLNENSISDDIKGIKGWLDEMGITHGAGNIKDTKAIIDSIVKRLKVIKRSI